MNHNQQFGNRTTRHAQNTRCRQGLRNKALVSTVMAALATGMSGGVAAQFCTSVGFGSCGSVGIDRGSWSQTLNLYRYIQSINNGQTLTANVSAPILGSSIAYTGIGNGFPSTFTNNTIYAGALGNNAPTTMKGSTLLPGNSIDLGLLGVNAGPPPVSGLGILSGQIVNGSDITASIPNDFLRTSLTNHTTGAVTNTGNTINAAAAANQASSGIIGDLPTAAFNGNTGGLALVQFGIPAPAPNAEVVETFGDLAVTNSQSTLNADVRGTLDTAHVQLLDNTAGNVIAAFTNSNNTLGAVANGNNGTNLINAQGYDGLPLYHGSAAVVNAQGNLFTALTATVEDSDIATAITGTNNFRGTLDQSGNAISAGVQGNAAGNSLNFANGIGIQGDTALAGLGLNVRNQANSITALELADLTLLNVQSNLPIPGGTGYVGSISDSNITATLNSLASTTATATLNDNAIQATTGGNAAANAVSVDAGGAALLATTAVGNLQANYSTPITATVDTAQLGLHLIGTGNSNGLATVASNAIGAQATGNVVETGVDLAATTLRPGHELGAIPPTVDTSTPYVAVGTQGLQTGGAGINVGNLQGNYKFQFGAIEPIEATVLQPWLGIYFTGGITGGGATLDLDQISAGAMGNTGQTALHLTATNASQLAASLTNGQFNDSPTLARISDGLLGVYLLNGSVANADLTLTNSGFDAAANGNLGVNALDTSFTNATLGVATVPWASSSLNNTSSFNQAYAALTLLSNQANRQDITADLPRDQLGMYLGQAGGGNLTNVTLTLGHDALDASALANGVQNRLNPGIGVLTTDAGTSSQIASLGNLQQDFGADVSATIDPGAAANGAIYALFHGSANDADITLNFDTVSALAGGNLAGADLPSSVDQYGNQLAVTGTIFTPTPLAVGNLGRTGFDGSIATSTVSFALQNMQTSLLGSREATISNASIRAIADNPLSTVRNGSFDLSHDAITTLAYDNKALGVDATGATLPGNLLQFGTPPAPPLPAVPIANLSTTGALQNVQISDATLSSGIDHTHIAVDLSGTLLSATPVTLGNNLFDATARGNQVGNEVDVYASQLSGDSIDLAGSPGFRGALLTPPAPLTSLVFADYGLSNIQTRPDNAGNLAASLNTIGVELNLPNGSLQGGSATLSDNIFNALALPNDAGNAFNVGSTNVSASFALLNQQLVGTNANASASIDTARALVTVGVNLGTSTAVPVTVGGNAFNAHAGLNTAANLLDVQATGIIANAGVPAPGATTDIGIYAGGYTGAVADYALTNSQRSFSSASSQIANTQVGLTVSGAIGNNALNSPLIINGNALNALSWANRVSNVLNLRGASSIAASSALANLQHAEFGTIQSTIRNAAIGLSTPGVGTVRNASIGVSSNTLLAQAMGNDALNALAVLPSALNIGVAEATLAAVSASAYTATASHSLLNAQFNGNAISASISTASIGINAAALGATSPLLGSVATVSDNIAAAAAFGNRAGNAIGLASLSSGIASSALVSNQINVAGVSTTVTNMRIGVTAGSNSTSPVSVIGNTISATAIGNSVTNRIGFGISP